MSSDTTAHDALSAARRIAEGAAERAWRGSDPYDGLWWGWSRPLTGGRRRRQAIVQLHARLPFDLRRMYRREPPVLAKALGLFLATEARLGSGDAERAARMVELLGDGPAWGYPFDVQTRWSFYGAGTPNVVVSAFTALGLQDAARAFGRPEWEEKGRGAAAWVLERLYDPRGWFRYHEDSEVLVHNASLLGARVVARLLDGDPAADAAVDAAVERTLAAQRDDGGWPYGDGGNLGWEDCFHTGYVVLALHEARGEDPAVIDAVARGCDHMLGAFVRRDHGVTLYPRRPSPQDGHSTGTLLSTVAAVAGGLHRDALEAITGRALRRMVRGDRAVHRRHRGVASRVRYVRWADGHLALGLADAARALAGDRPVDPAIALTGGAP